MKTEKTRVRHELTVRCLRSNHFAKKYIYIYIYIYQCFQKVREGRCNINEMWLNPSKGLFLSFCEYHTVCVETSVGSQRPFSWAFCEYHSGCGWVNVYVWERLFGPKGSLLLERQSHLGSFPDRRSMLLKGRFPWIHFTVKERTTLLNQYSLFCSIKKKVHAIQRQVSLNTLYNEGTNNSA